MHVLIVAIGPVQEFIESARKCRDLWFGSWLLSELSRAAAQGIVESEARDEGDVLVFPGARLANPDQAVANKVVARVDRPQAAAAAAEARMRGRLSKIRNAAFALVGRGEARRAELFKLAVAESQVDGLIELVWASAEECGDDGYRAAIEEAEARLAAVKNTKVWGQPEWAREGVPKSSLDGVRESVLDERLFPNPRGVARARDVERLRRSFGVHGAERLCGVGLLKRFGNTGRATTAGSRPERIFSTSHVASGPFRAGLARLRAGESWSRFAAALEGIHGDLVARLDTVPAGREDAITGFVDGSVFYEGRVTEALEELGLDPQADRSAFDAARQAVRRFLSRTKALGEPTPYYALLLGDGDRMGASISAMSSFTAHRDLSRTLEAFASSARKTVEQVHHGALVYSGGDDVLALLPLHTVIGCAAELAAGFARAMAPFAGEGGAPPPTLSVGVAIVHHLLPLDEALALVRSTEKLAKRVPDKNALAVVVKRRGGERVEVTGTWGSIEKELEALIDLHRAGAVSAKTQYELMDIAARLDMSSTPFRGSEAEAAELRIRLDGVRTSEARRTLDRKRAEGGAALAAQSIEALEKHLSFRDPARLGRALYVAQLLAAARDQAEPKVTPERAEEVTP